MPLSDDPTSPDGGRDSLAGHDDPIIQQAALGLRLWGRLKQIEPPEKAFHAVADLDTRPGAPWSPIICSRGTSKPARRNGEGPTRPNGEWLRIRFGRQATGLARNPAEVDSWPALFAARAVVGVNNEVTRPLVRN